MPNDNEFTQLLSDLEDKVTVTLDALIALSNELQKHDGKFIEADVGDNESYDIGYQNGQVDLAEYVLSKIGRV